MGTNYPESYGSMDMIKELSLLMAMGGERARDQKPVVAGGLA